VALGDNALPKKQKIGRPRSKSPMVHTAVVLPRDLLDQLRTDAEARGHGLSTEIRQRLLRYDVDRLIERDQETTAFVEAIKLLSDNLARDLGKRWHQHPYALAAFRAGVAALLAQYRPEGDESVRPDTRFSGDPNDPPDLVGRMHARFIWVASAGGRTRSEAASGKD
jgi:hypothetical protein